MKPESLFSVLADPTRLRAVMLIRSEGETCVCELTHALRTSQPKMSRHLAYMREAGMVTARREGNWMHYRLDPALPSWANDVIAAAHKPLCRSEPFRSDLKRLAQMSNRPERACA